MEICFFILCCSRHTVSICTTVCVCMLICSNAAGVVLSVFPRFLVLCVSCCLQQPPTSQAQQSKWMGLQALFSLTCGKLQVKPVKLPLYYFVVTCQLLVSYTIMYSSETFWWVTGQFNLADLISLYSSLSSFTPSPVHCLCWPIVFSHTHNCTQISCFIPLQPRFHNASSINQCSLIPQLRQSQHSLHYTPYFLIQRSIHTNIAHLSTSFLFIPSCPSFL